MSLGGPAVMITGISRGWVRDCSLGDAGPRQEGELDMAGSADREPTVIVPSTTDKVVLFGGLALLGLVLGFFLPRIAEWSASLPWVPFQYLLEFVAGWQGWWVAALLAVAGVLLAGLVLEDTLKVTVADTEVRFRKRSVTRTVPRDQVHMAFLDGKEIVLQDATSRELVREPHDLFEGEARKTSAAFEAHGYPWSADGDPYRDAFRRWIEDTPELPATVNAVLKARAKAAALGGEGKADVRELRDEVAKLGYVIRDDGHRQYWRPIDQTQTQTPAAD